MRISFADLPYAPDALEPHYRVQTVQLHYGKHHRGYFDKLSGLIRGTKFEDAGLEDIIKATAKDPAQASLFNNAGQIWNHDLFWRSMRPGGGGEPGGELRKLIDRDFGGHEQMRKQLHDRAVNQFGSGWAWLCYDGGKLSVTSTSNADTPLAHGMTALLAIDVWEHAYYLDYQNRRADFVEVFLSKLVDWDAAAARLNEAAGSDASAGREAPKRAARR